MVDQSAAEKATQYLVDSAIPMAEAKGELVLRENMLRAVKATAMRHSGETSAAAQEREAYASDQYAEAVMALQRASLEYEKYRALREAARMKIEMFRSINANQRGAERGYGSAA